MPICPRCKRDHSPRLPCGIPPYSTMHSPGLAPGARIGIGGAVLPGIPRKQPATAFPIPTKPLSAKKGVSVLKKLLEEARIQEKNVVYMLTATPVEMPKYDDLLDRLGKIEKQILQLNQQIIARESR